MKDLDWIPVVIGTVLAGIIASVFSSMSQALQVGLALTCAFVLYIYYNEKDKRRRWRTKELRKQKQFDSNPTREDKPEVKE